MSRDSRKLTDEIVARLDVVAEFAALGVEFVRDGTPNANGWVPCRAVGREDRNPSAAVNVSNGVYCDLGAAGGRQATHLFDFAVQVGAAADWIEARREYATKAGLAKRLPKKEQRRPQDKLEFTGQWNPILVRGLVKATPPLVNADPLTLVGAEIARYPSGSPQPQYVVALPCYGPGLTNEPPRGWVIQASSGRMLSIYQGEGQAPAERKRSNIGETGLIGRHALERIAAGAKDVELVFKVEGVSDLLALQSVIPGERRNSHLVLTNACGANEVSLPKEVAPVFSGLHVVVIHDADEPGQDGAALWLGALRPFAASVVNVRLPFDVTPNHGKDLRDWLNEGGTFDGLLAMVEAARGAQGPGEVSGNRGNVPGERPAESHALHAEPAAAELTEHQLILKKLGAIVLGHYDDDDSIVAFAIESGKVFRVKDVDHYGIARMMLHLGAKIEEIVATGPEPGPGQIPIAAVRRAFAAEGEKRRITNANSLGVGIWEINGRLILVGSGEGAILNGELVRTRIPSLEGRICDFGEAQPWFDFDWLTETYAASADPAWCRNVLDEAIALFERWDNWRHADTPRLVAGLIVATWLQTIWPWRPQIAVVGPTNCGKSMFLQETLQHIFGPTICEFAQKATEAGIRQAIRHTARVLIVDEFENDANRAKILELFRTSSRGGNILRGTANQKGASYHLRHIPWVGAIETGMKRAADRNRYVMLELGHVAKGRGIKLKVPPPAELRELGLKLMVVGMRHWRAALRISAVIRDARFDVDNRIVESYCVPVAILACVGGLSDAEAVGLMETFLRVRDFTDQSESDEERLLSDIYESSVVVDGGKRLAISDLLRNVDIISDREKHLSRCGLRVVQKRDERFLFLVPSAIGRELLNGSEFKDANLTEILMRVPGARRARHRMGGHQPHGAMIPFASIEQLIRPDGEAEEADDEQNASEVF